MSARLKVYYLHNIDGRRCGMIAATSKAAVRKVARVPASEICEAGHDLEAQAMAWAEPGVLFVARIHDWPQEWQRYEFGSRSA